MIEKTLCLIKPGTARDAKKKVEIIQLLIDSGFKLKLLRKYEFTKSKAETFYREHKGEDYFTNLVKYTCSDYHVAILIEGLGVIDKYRELIGATDPKEAKEGTIRQLYGKGLPDNAVHGSDSKEAAEREIRLIFPEVRR
jgi:nucleoside-diphosphate kinase